jgi:hypothetical protein
MPFIPGCTQINAGQNIGCPPIIALPCEHWSWANAAAVERSHEPAANDPTNKDVTA